LAFSNTPANDTYRTVPIKFDATPTLRSVDNTVRRDSHIINFFYDRISQENKEREVTLKKRPGISTGTQSLSKAVSTDTIRGYFYEEQEDIYFWAVGNKVYKYIPSPAGSYTALVATLATSSGEVCFDLFQKASDESVYILFSDGTNLWSQKLRTYPDTAAVSVSDADFPGTGHMPKFVVLDGYVFIAKGNTIYNSDLDDFSAWTAGKEIDCEMSSDNIKALIKNKNYILAIGYDSLEIFWDGGDGTSPLQRNDSGFKSIGLIGGIASVGDITYFLGQEKKSLPKVFRIEGFKVEPVSNAVVERTLEPLTATTSQINTLYGNILTADGHTFYCLSTPNITWVLDTEEKFWYEWRAADDTPLQVEACWAKHRGGQFLATKNTSTIDFFSPLVYNDKNSNFTASYTTEDSLFGSVNWKTANRLSVVSDRYLTTGSSILTVQWSDNDWADGPTGSTTVNLFLNLPKAHRLGRFRNRSFRVLYSDNYPLRIKLLELEINIGSH